jgi:phospholipid/cholesterol/gamma-HCH transport system substrate-binding protein
VFGNKYISFSSSEHSDAARISDRDVIDVSSVTSEFNTLFETVTEITEQVDPIKLNQTLSATSTTLQVLP